MLAIWLLKKKGFALRLALRRVVAPLALAVVVSALATGYYFWRVTGNPFQMPYQVDRDTYAVTPYFLWQTPARAPIYRQDALRDFYLHTELDFYAKNRSLGRVAAIEAVKVLDIWLFYVGPALTLPLIFSLWRHPTECHGRALAGSCVFSFWRCWFRWLAWQSKCFSFPITQRR